MEHFLLHLIFSQVFVLLAEEHGGVHPMVYGLLRDKATITFNISMLIELWPNLIRTQYCAILKWQAFRTVSRIFSEAHMVAFFIL